MNNDVEKRKVSISFVIPCLNEERTLPFVLEKIVRVCHNELKNYKTEIILSDNGSIDKSIEIAKSYGARVGNCPIRGYGAALKYGISIAENDVIVFADADDTYDFMETPVLISEIEKGYDLVIGSRLNGTIHKGAMPFLHHYLGTPILNFIINNLYSHNGNRISDCNSGFRCFRKEGFNHWKVQSDGMEFASEMLVKSMKYGSKISEAPISLYPDHPGRKPHLKTWRDGMRHLLRILVDAPYLFRNIGVTTAIISWIFLLICLFSKDYLNILGMSLFGIHTMMFSMLGGLLGQMIWGIGLFISVRDGIEQNGLYSKIINLSEDVVFGVVLGLFLFSLFCFIWIFATWASNDFRNLALQKETLMLVSVAANGLILLSNIFTVHLLKRT